MHYSVNIDYFDKQFPILFSILQTENVRQSSEKWCQVLYGAIAWQPPKACQPKGWIANGTNTFLW